MLLAVAAFDELASGVITTAAPAVEREVAASHAGFAVSAFVVPSLIALVIEPILFVYADRYPRAYFVRGGLVAMAVGCAAAAVSPSAPVLAAALGLLYVAVGSASALAQATLVDAHADARGKVMARWTLASAIGDLVAPALLAGLAALGGSWRAAFGVAAVGLAVWALVAWRTPLHGVGASDDDAADDDAAAEPAPAGVLETLRLALSDRWLIAWLFGVALCDLLDEILVVFATIHVDATLGGGAVAQSAVVASLMVGGMIGLVVLDRLLARRGERGLLVAASLATVVALAAWIAAPVVWASVVLAAPLGATSATLYPLAAAQAYARRPGASGTVLAAGHLFTPLGLALPWLIGALADRAGTTVALAALVVQPLGLVVLAAATRAPRRGVTPRAAP